MDWSIGFSTGSSFWISVPGMKPSSSSMLTFGRQIMILFTPFRSAGKGFLHSEERLACASRAEGHEDVRVRVAELLAV